MTDYTPLQYLFKQQDLNKRQTQWLQELIDATISIVYQLGKQAIVLDALIDSLILRDSMDKCDDAQPSR